MWRSTLMLSRSPVFQPCRKFRSPRELPVAKRSSSFGIVGKSVAFTAGSTCAVYGGATIWNLETRHKKKVDQMKDDSIRYQSPGSISETIVSIEEFWKTQTPGEKQFCFIFVSNAIVLAMWKVPRLSRFMNMYFSHSPVSNKVSPMLLSMFSHQSVMHFACNMYVLNSFSKPGEMLLGTEQLFATYITAGLMSSLTSLCFKRIKGHTVPSLGASGAILGIVGLTCAAQPQALISIAFLPMFVFSAGKAIKALIAFDAAGVLMGWKLLDHAAHLGGALYGILYFHEAHKLYAWYNRKINDVWSRIRSK